MMITKDDFHILREVARGQSAKLLRVTCDTCQTDEVSDTIRAWHKVRECETLGHDVNYIIVKS